MIWLLPDEMSNKKPAKSLHFEVINIMNSGDKLEYVILRIAKPIEYVVYNKWIQFLFYIIMFQFGSKVIFNFLVQGKFNNFIVNIPNENIRTYTLGIWQIQASVSVIVFSILALVTSRLDTEYYGIKIRQFLTLPNNQSLSFINIVSICIALICFNYFNFLYENLNAAIAIFGLNMVYVGQLIYMSHVLLFKPEYYRSKIKNEFFILTKKIIERENKSL